MIRSGVTVATIFLTSLVLALPWRGMTQSDPWTFYTDGVELGCKGDFASAYRALTEASRLLPDEMRVSVVSAMASDCAGGRMPVTVALRLFDSVFADDNGNHEDALDYAREVCKLAPDYSMGHLNFGNVLGSMLEHGEAGATPQHVIDAYRKALELDPTSGLAHYHIALAYLARGNQSKTRDHLSLAKLHGINVPQEISSQVAKFFGPASLFRGLIGPLTFIVNAPRILFGTTPAGSYTVDALLGSTWGRGGGWYRVGFVIGVLILFSAPLFVRVVSRGRPSRSR